VRCAGLLFLIGASGLSCARCAGQKSPLSVERAVTPVASGAPSPVAVLDAPAASASSTVADAGPASDAAPNAELNHASVAGLVGGAGSVRGELGAVSSVEPRATRAGVDILERGGNAVDAAVAVAYVLAVTHPSAGNLGGGGFMLVRPPGGPTVALDFRETAPTKLTRDQFDAMQKSGGQGPVSVWTFLSRH